MDDLGLEFPPLDVPLERIEHDLIEKAQRLPEEHASGGAERIRALADHLWFKVKVGEYREAICQSSHSGKPVSATTNGQRLIAWVKSQEADTYLAISAEGFLDPQ